MLNISKYRIIAIGKIRKDWIKNGIELYLKRLPEITITEIRDSNLDKETDAIKSSLSKNENLICLSETGKSFTSVQFANFLESSAGEHLAFAIGGANGLSTEINELAQVNLSLSNLTFPHEIARLLLIEQLYRAQTIIQGGPYHRR